MVKKLTHFFTDGLHTDFLFWIVAEVVQQDVLKLRKWFQVLLPIHLLSILNISNIVTLPV